MFHPRPLRQIRGRKPWAFPHSLHCGDDHSWLLLIMTFLLGVGAALNAPAWQATTSDLMPREEVPAAVALSAVSMNARGRPAIGHTRERDIENRPIPHNGSSRAGIENQQQMTSYLNQTGRV
jgi:Transmembrane secretion effector